MIQGKLLKDRYFDYGGQVWDLQTVKRKSGENEQGLNNRIDELNTSIQSHPKAQAWFITLFLTEGQVIALPTNWQVTFHPKTYIMLARPAFTGKEMPDIGVWHPVDFVWVSNEKVLTDYTPDNLNYRFRQLSSAEAAELKGSIPTPEPPVDTTDDTTPETPVVVNGDNFMHMKCPYCQKVIF